jgi:hypothetical protein
MYTPVHVYRKAVRENAKFTSAMLSPTGFGHSGHVRRTMAMPAGQHGPWTSQTHPTITTLAARRVTGDRGPASR